jgi:hypothetical protein
VGLLDIFKTKRKLTPEELAQRLFSSFVVDEEPTIMSSQYDGLKTAPGFQSRAFERQKFIYLAASIAIALTNASSRDSTVIEVIPHFRRLVMVEMQKRWGDREQGIDSEIEQASRDYGALLFTSPENNQGLSFDWSKDWLARIGIHESNPAVLFLMSTAWKTQFVQTAKVLSQIRVVSYET